MRFQSWDVLVFPDMSKIPQQEFKTSCQVIVDTEGQSMQPTLPLLPTVTCFIPALPAGAPFRISIHSWENPVPSRNIQQMKQLSDSIVFEARLFIDGKISGSKYFDQSGPWPTVIEDSIELDKHGEFDQLKFPEFPRELLSQAWWTPGDDIGRVKVIVAEGFARDSINHPFERVKNLVSFSFQHAPLDVLEESLIAWPNAAMWREASVIRPFFASQAVRFSPQHSRNDQIENHGHSPRRTKFIAGIGSMLPPPNAPIISRLVPSDPFIDPPIDPMALDRWRQASSSGDISMPDYSTAHTRTNSSRHASQAVRYPGPMDTDRSSMQSNGAYDSLCEALMPSAPVNTPQNEPGSSSATTRKPPAITKHATVGSESEESAANLIMATRPISRRSEDFTGSGSFSWAPGASQEFNVVNTATSKTANPASRERDDTSLTRLMRPTAIRLESSNVKSRKENFDVPHGSDANPGIEDNVFRRVSGAFDALNGNNKRQRIVTPASRVATPGSRDAESLAVSTTAAAGQAMDNEEEPRSSPLTRKVSRAGNSHSRKGSGAGDRVVLGGLTNV